MLSLAISAAKKAGQALKTIYQKEGLLSYTYKDPHNIVSDADIISERIIFEMVRESVPDHSFFSEEKGMLNNHSDYLWIVDPLDGTTNFTHKFPHFCVSIALVHKEIPLLGVIYDPISEEFFSAQSGKGARRNGNQIRSSACNQLEKAVILISRGANSKEKERSGMLFQTLSRKVRTIRVLGASALDICYTACGRFDALILNGGNHYDVAAATLIAKEAGLILTDWRGSPWKFTMKASDILIATKALHKKLLPLLYHI